MAYGFNNDKSKEELNGLLVAENTDVTIGSIPANSSLTNSKSISKTGYAPMGIIGISGFGINRSTIIQYATIENNKIVYAVVNNSSSAQNNLEIIFTVLYMKNS